MEARIIDALNRPRHFFNLLDCKTATAPLLPQSFENFKTTIINEQLAGFVGFEQHGPYGMLFSLAISRSLSTHEVTDNLLTDAERLAMIKKLEALYLLTENAAGYFERQGYRQINRADVPDELHLSSKFINHCAVNSVVMVKVL